MNTAAPLFDPTHATLELPTAPGLGFEPDQGLLERYTIGRSTVR